MEQVLSISSNNKITLGGYICVKQKTLANNVTSYECELRRGSGKGLSVCKARVKIAADMTVVGYVNTHSHAPDDAHCQVQQVRARIKRRAEETEEAAQQILGQELQHLSQQAAVQMALLCPL